MLVKATAGLQRLTVSHNKKNALNNHTVTKMKIFISYYKVKISSKIII